MSKIKILVCCHKPDKFMSDDVYMPIQVGKANSKFDLGIQGDNEGDNISIENPHFCELTGLYWAWKNMKPVEYIGLCHYRRYFNFHTNGSAFTDSTIVKTAKFDKLDLSIPDIDKIFKKYDVVLSRPKCYPCSLFCDYSSSHVSEDLRELEKVVTEISPEYVDAFRKVFYKNNKLSHYNMMIMRWGDFNEYCEWLFEVLFEVKKRINIENYNIFQGRIFGYMSERLLMVFVLKKQMRIKHYPIFWINDDIQQRSLINRAQHFFRYNLAFILQRPYK